jgi:succinoglycan biosynthesis transport protein ExoP
MPPHSDDFAFRPDDDPQGAYASATSGFGIREGLFALRRDWLFPVLGCCIGMVMAVLYIASVPPLYTSSARILVDRSTNRYLQLNKIVDEPVFDQGELASQIHILSSESIVIPVVRSMDLTHDSEFAGAPTSPLRGALGAIMNGIAQTIGWNADAKIENAADHAAVLERIAVEAFFKRLTVYREDVANVINVTFASIDPNKAARIANAIADTYLAANQQTKFKSTKIASELLQDRLTELKVQAIEADRALQNYKVAHNLENTEKGLPIADQQISNVGAELTKARIAMAEAKARLDQIRRGSSAVGETSIPAEDTVITKLRSQYMELADKVAEINPRVEPGHEAVTKLQKRMIDVQGSIRTETERLAASEYQNAKVRERELSSTMDRLLAELGTRSQAQVTMRDLESSAETLRTLYASLLQKYQEINAAQTQSSGVQDVRIVTRAAPPLHRNSRKGMLILGGSLALGLFLGAGAAVTKEWIADPFRTPDVLTQATGVHAVILPLAMPSTNGAQQSDEEPGLIEELVLDEPYSRFTETLRSVKTLINTQIQGSGKVIGVVSSLAKEGKTTIAANLGALMITPSGAHIRGLIIDGDLHMRRLTARLAPDAREGLIEALADPSRLSAVVRKRPRSGLDVLPCVLSARLPNAAELLGSAEMERLLIAARKSYDFIIIEVPPIMSVVDVKVIERFIDRFIFVVEWGQTKRRLVLEALSEAHMIRERLVSMILNKADPSALRTIEAYKGARFKDYYEG